MEQAVNMVKTLTFPIPWVCPVNLVFFGQHLEFFGFRFRRYTYLSLNGYDVFFIEYPYKQL